MLLDDIRRCTICRDALPHTPRPVVRAKQTARILIAGQAPGRKVHASGVPFDDKSGDRLRDWLGVDRETFYDDTLFAIVPMGFCFPGTGNGGDLPPRKECAENWREPLLSLLPNIELVVVIGRYALDYHLPPAFKRKSVTACVGAWRDFYPKCIPLAHPSPRNIRWFQNNPAFEGEVIPALQKRVKEILSPATASLDKGTPQ